MTSQLLLLFAAVSGIAYGEEKALPPRVDLQPEFDKLGITPRVQGERDVCSIFAVTALADFESNKHEPLPGRRLSEEFLIWAGNQASGLTGDQAMFYKATRGLNALGACSQDLMPYGNTPNPGIKPSPKALAEAKSLSERWRVHWIKRWNIVRHLTPVQMTAIKRALAEGHPVACGLRWPKKPKGPDIAAVPPPDAVQDGHSIVFIGYEDDPNLPGGGKFLLRNSWGSGWGHQGYGSMCYAYAEAYANDALWLQFEHPLSEVPAVRYEAETMKIVSRHKCETTSQKMAEFGGRMWSHGEQLFCKAEKGGAVELAFEVQEPGPYRVRVLGSAAPDFGVVRIFLDGKPAGPEFDLYSGRVCPAGSLELGRHELGAGHHVLRLVSVGKNPASGNDFFGIDALDLIRPK